MNLRDLISQSQPSSYNSTADEGTFQNYLLTQKSVENLVDPYLQALDTTQSEQEIDGLETYVESSENGMFARRNLWKRKSETKVNILRRDKKTKVFRSCPEAVFRHELRNQNTDHSSSYLTFCDISKSSHSLRQKALLKHIWNACAMSRDYDGAAMAIELLSDIDSIDASSFLQFTDLLRECGNTDVLINQIISGIKFYRNEKSTQMQRSFLYSRIAELLVSMENANYEQTSNFIQNHFRDQALNNSAYLLAINVVILVLQSIKIASDVLFLCGTQIVSPSEVAACPLRFSTCVEALHAVAFLNLETQVGAVAVMRAKCSKGLMDLKDAFSLVLRHSESSSMDIHVFYIAYLLGMRKYKEASAHVLQLEIQFCNHGHDNKESLLSDNGLLLQRFYLFKLRFLCSYSRRHSVDNSITTSSRGRLQVVSSLLVAGRAGTSALRLVLRTLQCWAITHLYSVRKCHAPASQRKLILTTLYLASINLIKTTDVLDVVCDAIEYAPPSTARQHPHRQQQLQQQQRVGGTMAAEREQRWSWSLWRVLANMLLDDVHYYSSFSKRRKVDFLGISDGAPLHPDSDIYPHFVAFYQRIGEVVPVAVGPSTESFSQKSATIGSERTAFMKDCTHFVHFEKARNWWGSTVLSTTQLGPFYTFLLEFELLDLLGTLEKRKDFGCNNHGMAMALSSNIRRGTAAVSVLLPPHKNSQNDHRASCSHGSMAGLGAFSVNVTTTRKECLANAVSKLLFDPNSSTKPITVVANECSVNSDMLRVASGVYPKSCRPRKQPPKHPQLAEAVEMVKSQMMLTPSERKSLRSIAIAFNIPPNTLKDNYTKSIKTSVSGKNSIELFPHQASNGDSSCVGMSLGDTEIVSSNTGMEIHGAHRLVGSSSSEEQPGDDELNGWWNGDDDHGRTLLGQELVPIDAESLRAAAAHAMTQVVVDRCIEGGESTNDGYAIGDFLFSDFADLNGSCTGSNITCNSPIALTEDFSVTMLKRKLIDNKWLKNPDNTLIDVQLLGCRMLELLTYQCIVCTMLQSQDCLFVVRVVQILFMHASLKPAMFVDMHDTAASEASLYRRIEAATRCLSLLSFARVNLRRALRLAGMCAHRSVDATGPAVFAATTTGVVSHTEGSKRGTSNGTSSAMKEVLPAAATRKSSYKPV